MSEFWDRKFSVDHYQYGQAPNTHLAAQAARLPAGGRALVPGDGEGRNGVWLAERGFQVVSVDSSAIGLEKARRLAVGRGVGLATVQADLTTWDWPVGQFDVVASIFLHLPPVARARAHAGMVTALRSGGVLVLEAFSPAQLGRGSGGPKEVELLYRAEALRADFAALTILELVEADAALDEGPLHQGLGAVVRLVAVKP